MATLSDRFEKALVWATRLHAEQERKGSGVPYISHLLAVAASALEHGADEDQAIAALLHDAVEDQGGVETLSQIVQRFGPRVARIVEGCSDTLSSHPKPPWRERKEAYIAHLREASASVRLVSACDKLHNARSILRDLAAIGDEFWGRFTASEEESLWYYRSVVEALGHDWGHPIVGELRTVVDEIHRAAKVAGSSWTAPWPNRSRCCKHRSSPRWTGDSYVPASRIIDNRRMFHLDQRLR